jgi:hypothetical protein
MPLTHRLARRLAAAVLAATLPLAAQADLFYGGNTKGLPGELVELSVHARSGTVLEAIDMVPELDAVAGVLEFLGFDTTPTLLEDGSGLCSTTGCALSYAESKSFAEDEMLARWRFRIAANAPVGPVPFDPGVVFGEIPVALPASMGFEVLAIPEPATMWMLGAGGLLVAGVAARRRHSTGA